jgi:hypothetical protein
MSPVDVARRFGENNDEWWGGSLLLRELPDDVDEGGTFNCSSCDDGGKMVMTLTLTATATVMVTAMATGAKIY